MKQIKVFLPNSTNFELFKIGRFSSLEDAILARKKKEIELFSDTKTLN
jgi:hypothetical protein